MVLAFDGNDNLTDRYLWGPAVDQVLADENSAPTSANPTSIGNNTLWALGDNQNSVRDVVRTTVRRNSTLPIARSGSKRRGRD